MTACGVTSGQRRRADLTMIWFAAAVAFVMTGCASARRAPPESMPSSSAEGRQEMAELEREIARGRVALGLSPKEGIAAEAGARSSAPGDLAAPEMAPSAGAEDPSTPASSDSQRFSPTETSPPPAPGPALSSDHHQSKASEDEEETCPGPCRFTQAICRAAGRICRIASFLGESDAQQRCQRARQDCAEARRTTSDSCPEC